MAAKKNKLIKKRDLKKVEMPRKPEMHVEEEIHIEVPNAKKAKTKLPLSEKAEEKMEKVMEEFKKKELHSGSKKGPKVKSRKQAVAIGLSEAKKAKQRAKKKRK